MPWGAEMYLDGVLTKELIGYGGSAAVYAGVWNYQEVAVKVVQQGFQDLLDIKRALREVCIHPQLSHRHIVQFGRVLGRPERYLAFTMEMWESSLKREFDNGRQFSLNEIKELMYQILSALAYMHDCGIFHRDVKPANILLNQGVGLEAKICDFGLAQLLNTPDNPGRHTYHVVSRWYRAPEVILLEPYGSAVDMWAVGWVLGELFNQLPDSIMSGKIFCGSSWYPLSPIKDRISGAIEQTDQMATIFKFLGTDQDFSWVRNRNTQAYLQHFPRICSQSGEECWPKVGESGRDFIRGLLQFNPNDRLTAQQSLQHEWFDGMHEIPSPAVKRVLLPFDSQAKLTWPELEDVMSAFTHQKVT